MFYWGFIKHNVFYSKTCRTSILPRKTSNVTYVIKYEPIQHLINNPHINCKASFLLHADQNASGPNKNWLRGFWSATLFLCSGVQAVGEQAFHPVLLLQWLSWCLQLEISPHSSLNPPSPSTLMKAHTQHCQSVKQAPLSLWCLRDLANPRDPATSASQLCNKSSVIFMTCKSSPRSGSQKATILEGIATVFFFFFL